MTPAVWDLFSSRNFPETDDLLKDHKGVVVMEDILMFGWSEEEHNLHLNAVLRTIKQYGLKINKAKCHFGKSEIHYFGYIISAGT